MRRARHRDESFQMASLSWRYHSLVRAVVPEVSDLICAYGRDGARTWPAHPPQLHLAWAQIYGPELDRRCRPHLKQTNKSYRVDETYIRIKGQDQYLYRAVDSTGQTIDFLLTAKRDAAAAKRFFRKTLLDPANPQPRVINVDKNRAYPAAVEELKVEGTLRRRCRLRQSKYLNNIVEQDHRVSKKRVWLARGYQSFSTAWRTLQGIEAVHMIRKGRARWVGKR